MTTEPIISVIIVSFHSGEWLFRAVASALNTNVPLEVIVVDNGNGSETLAKLKQKMASEPRLRLIIGQGNIGFSKAANLGAQSAKGRCVLFLKPDSELTAGSMQKLLDSAVKLKRPFMLGARLVDGSGKGHARALSPMLTPKNGFIILLGLEKFFPKLVAPREAMTSNKKGSASVAISSSFLFMVLADFIKLSGFDERYWGPVADMDFCWRFSHAEGLIYYVHDVVVKQTGKCSPATQYLMAKQEAKGLCRYFYENFSHDYPQPVLWALDAIVWLRFFVFHWLLPKLGIK